MRPILLALALLSSACASTETVTIYHFSDYHSHAVPFYADGEHDSAGIARAIGYLEPLSSRDDVLIFNGGDTMNLGAPVWSDRYQCIEWSWWNGIVDAMAFGNHDADYGPEVFAECRDQIDYPILGANVVAPDGKPLFQPNGQPWVIFERGGVRLGVFALAGDDFPTLIRDATAPTLGVRFLDRVEMAQRIVDELRADEHVDLVVLIGHASTEDDVALAREVAGIDLILGTHSHRLEPLHQIEGTTTWMISPGQYLTYVSRVSLVVGDHGLIAVDGELVRMEPDRPEDPEIAARVTELQQQMESDPELAALFTVIGDLERELSNEDVSVRTNELGSFVMDLVRESTRADVALSTSSSFRGSLPPGPIRETDLRDVLPYDNRVVLVRMSGEQLSQLIARVESLRGTDSYAQVSGVVARPDGSGVIDVLGHPLDPEKQYTVATTDYLAGVAPRYRDLFEALEIEPTEIRVRDLVRTAITEP